MNIYDPNPAQYWWDHLTYRQRSFLSNLQSCQDDKTKEQYWYSRSQTEDLHKLPGWPETSIDDMRSV